MNWEEYISNPQYLADNVARKEFGERLMLAFKQKNISEGIQWYQAIQLHHRMRDWKVTYPPQLGSIEKRVDIVNMVYSGDIETTCLALQFGEADTMTSPEHWITQDRINWMVSQMKSWLGWA
jgi:hypothetical protein